MSTDRYRIETDYHNYCICNCTTKSILAHKPLEIPKSLEIPLLIRNIYIGLVQTQSQQKESSLHM